MRFRLVYDGVLGGQNAQDIAKHKIREKFHPQLETLWSRIPSIDCDHFLQLSTPDNPVGIFEQRSGITFCPLITDKNYLIAHLEVLFLRREEPGRLFGNRGDIDNRVKTLIDTLRMPSDAEIRRAGICPSQQPSPFHCLLKDDALVTSFSVETDRLLIDGDNDHVHIVITVQIRAIRHTWANEIFSA